MTCPHCGQAIKSRKTDAEAVWRARLKLAFPGMDLEEEERKARRWILLHPPRLFTRVFFEKWLARADKPVLGQAPAEWNGIQVGDDAAERKALAQLDLMPRRRQA